LRHQTRQGIRSLAQRQPRPQQPHGQLHRTLPAVAGQKPAVTPSVSAAIWDDDYVTVVDSEQRKTEKQKRDNLLHGLS
jgi:hypothetical protein